MVIQRGSRGVWKRAQSILEYSVLISVLCAVSVGMFVYMKNSVRSKMFVVQKSLNQAGATKGMPAQPPAFTWTAIPNQPDGFSPGDRFDPAGIFPDDGSRVDLNESEGIYRYDETPAVDGGSGSGSGSGGSTGPTPPMERYSTL